MSAKKDRPLAEEIFFPCKRADLGLGASQQARVEQTRLRLIKSVESPKAIATVARIFFYLLEGDHSRNLASAEKIAAAINEGPRYFGVEVGSKSIRNFIDRSAHPERDRYFEYVRFAALVIKAHKFLSTDPYIKELLEDFDVVKSYSAAASMSDADFEKFMKSARGGIELSESDLLAMELFAALRLSVDEQKVIQDQLISDRDEELFYAFRYTSRPGEISCTRLEIKKPSLRRPFLHYETKSRRRRVKREVDHNSQGLIFGYDGSIAFCGVLESSTEGMHFLVIPRPIVEIDGRIRALVLTPDIIQDGPPIVSRILVVRASNLSPELQVAGVLNASGLPSSFTDELRNFISNSSFGTIKPNTVIDGRPAQTFAELTAFVDELLEKRAPENWPFTILQEDGVFQKVNPFKLLNHDAALGIATDD